MQDYHEFHCVGPMCENCGYDSQKSELFRIDDHVFCKDCLQADTGRVMDKLKPKVGGEYGPRNYKNP